MRQRGRRPSSPQSVAARWHNGPFLGCLGRAAGLIDCLPDGIVSSASLHVAARASRGPVPSPSPDQGLAPAPLSSPALRDWPDAHDATTVIGRAEPTRQGGGAATSLGLSIVCFPPRGAGLLARPVEKHHVVDVSETGFPHRCEECVRGNRRGHGPSRGEGGRGLKYRRGPPAKTCRKPFPPSPPFRQNPAFSTRPDDGDSELPGDTPCGYVIPRILS